MTNKQLQEYLKQFPDDATFCVKNSFVTFETWDFLYNKDKNKIEIIN